MDSAGRRWTLNLGSYDTMTFVAPGDVVFSFYDTKIQAIGIVQRAAVTAPKPNFGVAGHYWDDIGWLVEVEFHDLPNPFRPADSTGERNELGELLRWCHELKCLARPAVQAPLDALQVLS